MHRTVQCSNPARAKAMCRTSVRDWHLGPRGCAAVRGDKVWACVSVKTRSCGIKRDHSRTLYPRWIRILDGYRRPGRDNRTVPTRRRGALVNIAHFWKFDGATAGNDFLTTAIKIRSMVGRRTAAVALRLTRADARELMRCNNRRALWNKRSR